MDFASQVSLLKAQLSKWGPVLRAMLRQAVHAFSFQSVCDKQYKQISLELSLQEYTHLQFWTVCHAKLNTASWNTTKHCGIMWNLNFYGIWIKTYKDSFVYVYLWMHMNKLQLDMNTLCIKTNMYIQYHLYIPVYMIYIHKCERERVVVYILCVSICKLHPPYIQTRPFCNPHNFQISSQRTQGISSLSQLHGLKILSSLDRTRGAFELTSIGLILRYHIKIFFPPKWHIKTENANRALPPDNENLVLRFWET